MGKLKTIYMNKKHLTFLLLLVSGAIFAQSPIAKGEAQLNVLD